MSIHTFLNDQHRVNFCKVKDKYVNELLQELRAIDKNILIEERTIERKPFLRKPVTTTVYTMYIDSDYDAQIINFCQEGIGSINTSVLKSYMVTYMLGVLNGYNIKSNP